MDNENGSDGKTPPPELVPAGKLPDALEREFRDLVVAGAGQRHLLVAQRHVGDTRLAAVLAGLLLVASATATPRSVC